MLLSAFFPYGKNTWYVCYEIFCKHSIKKQTKIYHCSSKKWRFNLPQPKHAGNLRLIYTLLLQGSGKPEMWVWPWSQKPNAGGKEVTKTGQFLSSVLFYKATFQVFHNRSFSRKNKWSRLLDFQKHVQNFKQILVL